MRVPTPNVSLIELVFCTKKNLSIASINISFEKASKSKKKVYWNYKRKISIG